MNGKWLGFLATVALAVTMLVGTTAALLLLDPRTTGAAALRTGGFAAGSVVALYALWLNDRRRRVEEERQRLDQRRQELDAERYALEQRRQDLEDRRSEHDRARAADERFARAVELLGHDAAQVRVGALHALAGLARTHPDYTQTTLDVLCSYLRRPMRHPRYAPDQKWSSQEAAESERELEVRLTAQRLVAGLLPAAGDADAPLYDLDLTRAALEYWDLSGLRIGTLTMRYAKLYRSTNLSGSDISGPAWFTGMSTGSDGSGGVFRCADATFRGKARFSGVDVRGPAVFDRTTFGGRTKFANSAFSDQVTMVDTTFESELDLRDCAFDGDLDLSSINHHGTVLGSGLVVNTRQSVGLPDGWAADPDTERARVRTG